MRLRILVLPLILCAVAAAVVAATLFFAIAHMDYRITSIAVVEGVVQRVVVAAIDGFVADA